MLYLQFLAPATRQRCGVEFRQKQNALITFSSNCINWRVAPVSRTPISIVCRRLLKRSRTFSKNNRRSYIFFVFFFNYSLFQCTVYSRCDIDWSKYIWLFFVWRVTVDWNRLRSDILFMHKRDIVYVKKHKKH